jgi:hypothetical protein
MITKPEPKPTIRRRRRRGNGDAGSKLLTTAAIADSYLRLCHDPCQDLNRWLAEDKSRGRVSGSTLPPSEKRHDENTTRAGSLMEDARRLCGHTLHPVQGRMDTDGKPRGIVDNLPARSRAGVVGHDQLRPLRAERGSDLGVGFKQFSILATQGQPRASTHAVQRSSAFVALARVVADAGSAGWPDSMVRELRACTTPAERNAWDQKWGRYLSGEAQRDKQYRPPPPLPPTSSGHQPS